MDSSLGFVAVPLTLRSLQYSKTPFAVQQSSRWSCRTRRSRARILALGAAPAPPSPSNGDEKDGSEAIDSMEPVNPVDPVDPAQVAEDSPAHGNGASSANRGKDSADVGVEDILSSPAFLKKKMEVLQKELAEANTALDAASDKVEYEKNQYIRLAADFENYRRRSSQDLRSQDVKSTAKVCKEILAVLDNFERATKAVNAETDREKAIDSSYQVINKQLLDALVKLNVTPVEALGEPFNPEIHEAIQYTSSDEYPEGIISAQCQRGYAIGEALVRPAVVIVSQGPGPEIAEGDSEKQESNSEINIESEEESKN